MSNLQSLVQKAHQSGDYNQLLQTIPYAQTLGVRCERFGNEVVFVLPKRDQNLGNPILPAIHGGVIGGFMEIAAAFHLAIFLEIDDLPRIVDFSLDYLRAGFHQETYAECRLTRQGNRVANVSVSAWQKKKQEPIALARAHFLLPIKDQ
ncbi:thioesterase [Hahella sp. CCB-MM4]|uniref:PaaI family thioesterase n=1 Tax=Hahella sp. (strain CCB-MM4) TaxID=1926491 RepID=UPI000B9AB2F3|nr:PaaI family thioesterase [Hahella sp. CCB-MM4]OZG72093.1 thioesterase [Hahella sp. CCB-MM4]